jgi:uncharacterized SAM-binding protein YcdF (DUF218 family)
MIRFILIPVLAAALFIVTVSFYLAPNDFTKCSSGPTIAGDCSAADAIVAVSGGDTNARTDKAIELYKDGWASLLIFSGAAQDKSGPSNAEAMAARAIAQGVPAGVIEIDEYSETTTENAENTQSIFERNGVSLVILVTSGYHQRRASLEFNKRTDGVEIKNYPTDDSDWTMWWWLTPRGWWLSANELAKIAVFYGQGILGR